MINKKIRFLSLLLILPVFILILSGCGKSVSQMASEKAAEKIIESQTGGAADIDIDQGNIKLNTEQGSMEAGSNVKLPDNFPADVYVIEGNIISSSITNAGQNFTVSIETDKNSEEVFNIYQQELKKQNWKITGTMNFGDTASITGEKGDKRVSVLINKTDNKTNIILGVDKK